MAKPNPAPVIELVTITLEMYLRLDDFMTLLVFLGLLTSLTGTRVQAEASMRAAASRKRTL